MEDPHQNTELSEADFVALLVKHEPLLRAYARVILPEWELVDEAIQEASVTLWQKRDQLEHPDGFVPWAKTVLRFKCLRQLEKLRARRPLLNDETLQTLADRGVERSAKGNSAQAQALQMCLGQFSEEHRELLLAPHSSTHTVAELAKQRNKSPNSLYKLLARLRKQLSECVDLRIAGEVN